MENLELKNMENLELKNMENLELKNICNNNVKNMPSQSLYDSFNSFIFDKDIKVLGKLLYRFKFFELTKELPGDIVELGVFKGSGVATFLKFIEIFSTHSNKKIIGFDLFNSLNDTVKLYNNGNTMKTIYSKVDSSDLTLFNVSNKLENINKDFSKFLLIEGDVCKTTKKFVTDNPGCRISLIYVDLDLDEPVYHSLINLWDKLLPGGYIIFDEYEYHKFDESNGVDKFLKEKGIEYTIKSTNWMAPTAFIIKK